VCTLASARNGETDLIAGYPLKTAGEIRIYCVRNRAANPTCAHWTRDTPVFGVSSDQNGSQGQRKRTEKVENADIGEKARQVIKFLYTPNPVCVECLFTRSPGQALSFTRQRLARARRAIHAIKILEPSSLSKYFGGRILFCDVEVSAQGHVRIQQD
jgi:hypothetical protein